MTRAASGTSAWAGGARSLAGSGPNRLELLRAARDGDDSAWEMVVLDILPLLRRAARSVVRDDQVVEDACQEALLVLCRRLPILDFAHGRSADAADGALTAWLVRTTVFSARGLCRTATRRQRRERASESATLTWEDEQECNERASLAWQH